MTLPDYETGTVPVRLRVREHWWQFWLPKYVTADHLVMYTRVGPFIHLDVAVDTVKAHITVEMESGTASGTITGLPYDL